MAFKRVQDLSADTTFKFETPGQKLEGYYLGSKTVETGMGKSQLHIFQTKKGNVGAWGSAQLDAKLKQCVGMNTLVIYEKMIKVPKGKMKTFDVQYDDANRIDVQPDHGADFQEDEETPVFDNSEYLGEEEDSFDEEEEAPAQQPRRSSTASRPAASAASAEQQAKVRAALANRK